MSRALRLVLWTITVSVLLAAAPRPVAPRPPRAGGSGNTGAAAKPAGPAGPTTAEAAAAKAAIAAAVAAPSFEEVPLFRLGGAAGLPAYLKASATTLADETGLSATGEIRTVAHDFATRDFTFDLMYRSGQPGERSHFPVGIGGEDFKIYSHLHGPGYNGVVRFDVTGQPEGTLGNAGDHPGPHLLRLAKRGATLTMALCVDFDGKTFEPTFSKTIPDFAAAAPALKRHNSPLFAGSGNGGTIEAVRLIIDGKPAPTGQAVATRGAATAPVPATMPGDAAKAGGEGAVAEDPPLFRLARTAGLPTYLKASGVPLATDTGMVAPEFRTNIPKLLDHDFRFDVVFRFKSDDEQAIFMIGLGTPGGDGVDGAVLSRVHGPGHNGLCTFNVAGVPEQGLGRLSHSAGPHLFRLEKRGNTLTMAISPDFDGKYDPVAVKTLPDLRAAAPSLTPRTAVAFIKGGTSIDAVRLSLDGKPLNAKAEVARADATRGTPSAAAGATSRPAGTQSPPDGMANLIRLDRALPAFFQPQPVLKFDPGGGANGGGRGLVLADSSVRTRATDFVTKDFTFDVVYRIAPGTNDGLFVGIGSDQKDRDRFPEAAGAHVFGAKHRGLVRLNVGRPYYSDFGNAGGEVGPHLVRLRKVGNSLAVEVSPSFQGQFEPAASITVADLKTGAPFLTARNSPLVIHGTGVVEQVRLVVDGQPLGTPGRQAPVASTSTPTPTTPTTSTPPAPVTDAPPDVSRAGVAKIARRQSSIRALTVSFTDTGAMLGGTMDLVLTATPGEARPDTPVTFVTPVGEQMKLVLDDVLRGLRVRYPIWEAERVELTFDDRISKKDGASIGAAVGTLLLSMLQGFEIDPKLAMTGDVTADGRVRPIGGVVAKIRAATNAGAATVALPADNYDQVADGLVYEGPALLSRIQVIGVGTLDEAAAAARVDRGAKLAAAVTLFAEVQASLKKSPGELRTKAVRDKLTMITGLAPNHVSAQLLLLASQDKQPRKLSAGGSLYYMAVAIRGVMPALKQQAVAADRQRVPPAAVTEGLRALDRLNPIADPAMQPLVRAYREFIGAVSEVQSGRGSPANLRAKAQAVEDAEAKVNANRDVMEKMLQEGV